MYCALSLSGEVVCSVCLVVLSHLQNCRSHVFENMHTQTVWKGCKSMEEGGCRDCHTEALDLWALNDALVHSLSERWRVMVKVGQSGCSCHQSGTETRDVTTRIRVIVMVMLTVSHDAHGRSIINSRNDKRSSPYSVMSEAEHHVLPSCYTTTATCSSSFLVHWATGQPKRAWADSAHQLGSKGTDAEWWCPLGAPHNYYMSIFQSWQGKVHLSDVLSNYLLGTFVCTNRRSYFYQSDVLSRKAHLSFPRYIMCLPCYYPLSLQCACLFEAHVFYFLMFLSEDRLNIDHKWLDWTTDIISQLNYLYVSAVNLDAVSNIKLLWLPLMAPLTLLCVSVASIFWLWEIATGEHVLLVHLFGCSYHVISVEEIATQLQ